MKKQKLSFVKRFSALSKRQQYLIGAILMFALAMLGNPTHNIFIKIVHMTPKTPLPLFRTIVFFLALLPWTYFIISYLNKSFKNEDSAIRNSVTNLHNRRFFDEQMPMVIAEAKRYKKKICLWFIDIDFLKVANDNYGHAVGDKLIRLVAETLRGATREYDVLSHFGGDEFVIVSLLNDEGMADYPSKTKKRINERLRELKIKVDKLSVITPSVSIGFSIKSPSEENVLEKLLKEADNDMYKEKSNKKRGE